MPIATRNQLTFGGGVNAVAPAHLIGPDQVATATNLDFSVEQGAARARRGFQTAASDSFSHFAVFKSYATSDITHGALYTAHLASNGGGTAGFGRYSVTNNTLGAYTSLQPTSDNLTQFGKYRQYTYVAGGTGMYKDDGTNVTQWLKQVPPAPSVTLNTGVAKHIIAATDSLTFLEGTGTLSGGTNTCIGDATTGRSSMLKVANIDLSVIGSFATDTLGVLYANIGFSDPQNVYRVSMDFAVDSVTLGTSTVTTGTVTSTVTAITTGFNNYFHGEYLPNIGRSLQSAAPTVDQLTGAAQQNSSGTAVSQQQIATIQSIINTNQTNPLTNINFSANSLAKTAIPKTQFQFVGTWTGTTTADAWAAVKAVRVTIESYTTAQTTIFTTLDIIGDTGHPLTDMNIGYTWYQTWAEIDTNGNIIGESAASPPAGPFQCVSANAVVVSTGTVTGSIAGITHVITYRQGGYTQAPYQVSTQSIGTATFTDSMSDIDQLLLNIPMVINVIQPSNLGPYSIISSEAFYDRMYIAAANQIRWSEIGRPDQFVITNNAILSDPGDNIVGMVVWPPGLIIVTYRSVYEITGSVFEGQNADFVIQKAAPRRGSVAPLSICRTPYGIPLVNYDGITMYQPGAGVDADVPWITEQIGDAFRGASQFDPAGLEGSRIPGINGNLFKAAASYTEGKLYLAVPTGTSAFNNTVFVMDFHRQKCWWYQYMDVQAGTGIACNSLYWDFFDNDLLAGSTNGMIQLETFVSEQFGSNNSTVPIPWNFQTRQWTVNRDTLVENLAIEYTGGAFEVDAIYDGTTTVTLGTCSSSSKTYAHLPMNGVVENNLAFAFTQITTSGTGTSATVANYQPHTAVYGVTFDSIEQPEKVHFYQNDYYDNGYAGDKLWDVVFFDLGMLQANTAPGTDGTSTISATGTVTAVTFIDGVAVMTNTIVGTGTPSAGRNTYTFSFPAETYGEIAYTTLTSTATGTQTASTMGYFKVWDLRYECRNEPARTTVWRTTIESLDEAICDAYDVDINPNGTVLATCYVDNTATQTNTITGTKRQSYTYKIPVETYGRTIFVLYNTTGAYFKHYNTWFHRRPEPDRWTNYVSSRVSTQEQHFDAHEVDVNPLGNTVLGTAFIDGTAYGTFTYTGSLRERFVNAFPPETYGRTTWTQFSVSTATDTNLNPTGGRFKYFADHFIGTLEPDKLTQVQKILPPWPSEHYVKTWIAELNPLGTCTGVFMVDGFAINTSTFTGTIREVFNVGLDINPIGLGVVPLETATAVEVRYTGAGGTGLFKHYATAIESDPKPFGKTSFAMAYKKIGGASQIDMARFWAIDIEVPAGQNCLLTSVWDIDGNPGFTTNTLTFMNGSRTFLDRIPFPPGGRGRLFQQRILTNIPVKIWSSSMDEERIGVKGFTRTSIPGTPIASSYSGVQYSERL